MGSKPTLTYAIQYFDETGSMRAPYLVCKGFVDAGWSVEILTTANARNARIDSVWDHVPVQKVNGAGRRARILKLAIKLLGKRNNQVVLTFVWDRHCIALMLSRMLFGSPYVVALDTYTHLAPWDVKNFLSRLRLELRYGLVLRNADIVLAETPKSFEHAQRFFRRPEVLHIPFCLWHKDLQEIEAGWDREGYRPKREPVIFYAGRLVERKNVHDLVTAFVRLSGRFPEWKLEIRGPATDTVYYAFLQDLVKSSGLDDRISLLPSLSGEHLYRRYRSTSIFCLPSAGEGMPTTLTEAMYFGGAIVAGGSGGVGYQLDGGTCGLLHEPGDVDHLTAHLETLMASEEERDEYMARARERMIGFFTWERYFPALEKKFRDLLHR